MLSHEGQASQDCLRFSSVVAAVTRCSPLLERSHLGLRRLRLTPLGLPLFDSPHPPHSCPCPVLSRCSARFPMGVLTLSLPWLSHRHSWFLSPVRLPLNNCRFLGSRFRGFCRSAVSVALWWPRPKVPVQSVLVREVVALAIEPRFCLRDGWCRPSICAGVASRWRWPVNRTLCSASPEHMPSPGPRDHGGGLPGPHGPEACGSVRWSGDRSTPRLLL